MNKKLFFTMGLAAMMAACSSEDVLTDVQNSQNSDLFAGIDKVEAGFEMGTESRLATKWDLEIGDRVGLAWLHDEAGKIQLTGEAYQNHPLYAEGGSTLKPKTSIYVGEYFSYAPYDESVVSIDKINFSIPVDADLLSTWNGLAKKAIYISPKWTTVSESGCAVDGEAGIDKTYTIYPRKFSNGVALNFDYENNKVDLRDETDNDKLYASDPEIFDAKVTYVKGNNTVSINKFQYAPTEEPIGDINWGTNINPLRNWETFKLAETLTTNGTTDSRNATLNTVAVLNEVKDGYSLKPSEHYFATRDLDKVKFYMNALPAMTEVDDDTEIEIVINTTYGRITITKPVNEIAYTAYLAADGKSTAYMAQPDGITKDAEGKDLAEGTYFNYTESFVQVLGKNGKFETEVDFSTAIMDGMHVTDDSHLIQLLRYYRDYKKGEYAEPKVNLYLDADKDGEFKISKTSIALMQSINTSGTNKIALNVCKDHGKPDIVVTNNTKEGQEVPTFAKVFGHTVDVYLQNQDWTWSQTSYKNTGNVATIYNRGNLTVSSANVEAYNKAAKVFSGLVNLGGAKINFTADVATLWKIDLTNNGIINIPATAHMRVYSSVVNDVTALTGVRTGVMGIINNNGVIGAVEDQQGYIYNYGKIYHNAGAKTFITYNEDGENFAETLETTKIGIVEMKEADANVSVSNTSNKGIITYTWPKENPVYESPAVVRFNYLIVEGNIEFTQAEQEIRYLEIKGADVYVTNKSANLKNLQGVIVDKGYALNITEGNQLMPAKAAYIKGYVYNGGQFTYGNDVTTYFGGEEADKENILKWSGF